MAIIGISSTYHFTSEYVLPLTDIKKEATVILEVDLQNKSYSIKPYCGTINSGFKFEQNSHKSNMWKAIIKSIDEAIDFAEGIIND